MKAVLQYRASPGLRQRIASSANEWLHVEIVDERDRDTFVREMHDADVLFHVLEPVTAAVIDQAPKLRLIQKLGIGVDTIDLAAAQRRGVAVCNMPGTNTRAVAELALLLMLATVRRVCELDAQTRAGRGWSLDDRLLDTLGELGGKTVGLIGMGAVGRCLTPMLEAIGSHVIYTDVAAVPGAPGEFQSLRELLKLADIVSLHLPLTKDTAGMINADALALMKSGGVLINTARGGLVDHRALYRALVGGPLRAAGLDVFESEPINPSHPLCSLPNVVLTPHLAWFTAETLQRSVSVFAENCRRLRDDEPLLNRVV
jgi:phosphoglycerate dehydrogenase-like enzyme